MATRRRQARKVVTQIDLKLVFFVTASCYGRIGRPRFKIEDQIWIKMGFL